MFFTIPTSSLSVTPTLASVEYCPDAPGTVSDISDPSSSSDPRIA
ncbi:MAG TPA: hypothetical protein VE987_07890 [Polyangiaceae bacterium]|nr:hypothetical protein [Polyangiaceae bacterium]